MSPKTYILLLSVFDIRGFVSTVDFIVSQQQRFSYENHKNFSRRSVNGCFDCS